MRASLYQICFVALLGIVGNPNTALADGMDFFQGTWEEALAQAAKEDKLIFVDAYTTWCGPCKMMASNVFPDAKVGEYYNQYFLNVKLDMEKGEGLNFRKKYAVSAYPSLFYIDGFGKQVHKAVGARDARQFIELGKEALTKYDASAIYAERYNKGERSPELVYKYIKALNYSGKPSLKIANEYLRTAQDFNNTDNQKILLEAIVEADSKAFELMEQNKAALIALASTQELDKKIAAACQATVQKALEYDTPSLLEDAVGKMKKHLPAEAKVFEVKSRTQYALDQNDMANYLKYATMYAKKTAPTQYEEHLKLANTALQAFPKDTKAKSFGLKTAETAAKKSKSPIMHLTAARIFNEAGERGKAIVLTEAALKLATQAKDASTQARAEQYLKMLGK